MKIFGREPAAFLALIEAALAFLVTFGLDGLSVEQATNISAVLVAGFGLLAAWTTVNTRLSGIVAVGKGLLVLMVSYGMNLSQEQLGLAVGVITAFALVFLRTNNSPTDTPLSNA